MLFAPGRHTIVAQSSIPEFAADQDPFDKYYIPGRWAAAALRPHTTLIVPDHSAIRAHITFLEHTLGQYTRQKLHTLYTADKAYLLDDDINASLLHEVRAVIATHLRNGRGTTIAPYRANRPFHTWRNQIIETDVDHIGDDEDFISRYGNKSVLHRNIARPKEPALLETRDGSINIPKGYICDTQEDLVQAFERLRQEGIQEMIIKPTHGSTGEGIQKVNTLVEVAAYTWPTGPFVLEACLPLDTDDDGKEVNCSLQFIGQHIIGEPTAQIINGTHWEGNVVPGLSPASFASDAQRQAQAALHILATKGHKGPGGFDFLLARGKAFLVDPNIGRYTGAHVPKYWSEYFAPGKAWATLEMPHHLSVEGAWEKLCRKEIAYDHDRQHGVFPICHLEGMWSMHIAIAKDARSAYRMIMEAKSHLS
ncbi:MAG: hypothetical protein HY817_02085 [Candidatus Abawacabacteria bacterium]|nr:hypothetical protein [Candidatus Abawacabacteria bacterium]